MEVKDSKQGPIMICDAEFLKQMGTLGLIFYEWTYNNLYLNYDLRRKSCSINIWFLSKSISL